MRTLILLILLLLAATLTFAQNASLPSPIQSGTFELGVWGGGGTGAGKSSGTQFITAGVRIGKVLTRQFGPSFLRGNFEIAGDLIPLYLVRQDEFQLVSTAPWVTRPTGNRQTVYGGGFTPVVLKWNFTRGRRFVPYFEGQGGVLITTHDVPKPDTDNVNFASGAAFGVQWFVREKRALVFSTNVLHVSNASMGDHNPGLNTTLQFRLGYHCYK
jgi:hypothetical protein